MLAYSRRVLEGELPHKDFLSAHMMGTPLLFTPVVAYGGDYTFLLGRYMVFIEFAVIAWLWTSIIARSLKKTIPILMRILLAVIAFCLCAHNFPLMPWYTIDGLLAVSIGIYLLTCNHRKHKMLGFVMLGVACLFKQNYALVIPPAVIFFGEWRRLSTWILPAIPVCLYYTFFLFTGAIAEAITQTTSRQEFYDTAIKGFISKYTFPWGMIIGYSSLLLIHQKNLWQRLLALTLMTIPLLYSAHYLRDAAKFYADASFFLLGTVIGMAIAQVIKKDMSIHTKLLIIAAITGWSVGISGGYNSPALASGMLFLFPAIWLLNTAPSVLKQKSVKYVVFAGIVFLFLITLRNFHTLRLTHIYRDMPAAQLTHKLDSVLPGGSGIYTSQDTYSLLFDLQKAKEKARKYKKSYVLLPEYAALWVKSQERNPFLMDWPLLINNQQGMIENLLHDLNEKHGSIVLIVNREKIYQEVPYKPFGFFEIATKIPKQYKKVGETKYFDLLL
jgi:hypothetical protein